ncbi:MAG TPA: hypothetical protein VHR66_13445 [Gemmataceae bacterium]|jgi:hypothetical protein|nr:hypothetical protein [Gemmataceae bacterium]
MLDPQLNRESEPVHGPTPADLRADYDDEFGRIRTPRQIARRRLLIPAIDFLILGILVAMASLGSAIFVIYEYIGDAADPLEYLEMVGLLTLCILGGALSALIIVAGDSMLRLRHHRVALIASYIVTSLSLASVYAILFYPFGIWALVLLYKTEVRGEFDKVVDPKEPQIIERRVPGSKRSPRRNPPMTLLAIGAFGLLFMLIVCFLMLRTADSTGAWDEDVVLGPIVICLVGAVGFGIVLVRGIQLYRRFPDPNSKLEPPARPFEPE